MDLSRQFSVLLYVPLAMPEMWQVCWTTLHEHGECSNTHVAHAVQIHLKATSARSLSSSTV